MKLDMMKAYDKVDWMFIEQMIKKFGFLDRWIAMVMRCVTPATSTVKLNGGCSRSFTPSRGLRQGGTLSPYFVSSLCRGVLYFTKKMYTERMR